MATEFDLIGRANFVGLGDEFYSNAGTQPILEQQKLFLDIPTEITYAEWGLSGEGIIASPLTGFKELLEKTLAWQRWAGTDYAESIYFNANRSTIEFDQTLGWINDSIEKMPFVILWMQDLVMRPGRCIPTYSIVFFVQDNARFRVDHNKSADYFATRLGLLINDLDTNIRTSSNERPWATEIMMISPPFRTELKKSGNIRSDFWSAAFHIPIGPANP